MNLDNKLFLEKLQKENSVKVWSLNCASNYCSKKNLLKFGVSTVLRTSVVRKIC